MSASLNGMAAAMDPHVFNYVLIPLLIFLSRICKDFKRVSDIVKERHPHAFYTAEEVKSIHTPPFPLQKRRRSGSLLRLLHGRRRLSGMAP